MFVRAAKYMMLRLNPEAQAEVFADRDPSVRRLKRDEQILPQVVDRPVADLREKPFSLPDPGVSWLSSAVPPPNLLTRL